MGRSESPVRVTASGRPVAAGGWRRALVGMVVGALAGAAVLVARRAPRGR